MKSGLLVLVCMFVLSVAGPVYAESHPEVFVHVCRSESRNSPTARSIRSPTPQAAIAIFPWHC